MSSDNSIRSFHTILYLILFMLAGCAEKTTTQAYLAQPPASSIVISPTVKQHSQTEDRFWPTFNIDEPSAQADQYTSLWQRLFALYALPEVNNKRIDHEIKRYLKHPNYLKKIQLRAQPYLHFIVDEIERNKIPGELALLPIVESAFNPIALSKSKASGLWQFMPATGRLFGLKQNSWFDGRRDIYLSTQAATDYLKQLSETFDNDWLLALAAYNGGRGTIKKAIRKNQRKGLATDYWSLPLRQETQNYIPRLLAVAKILAQSERYKIPLVEIPNKPYFSQIALDSQINLNIAADLAELPLAELKTLNPGLKHGITAPDGPFHLLIPVNKAEQFKSRLASTTAKNRMYWQRHRIDRGENLGIIARKYNTTVTALLRANQLKSSHITAGKTLLIPTTMQAKKPHKKASKQVYIVKKGDTFWNIARQFDIRSKDLAAWNKLSLKQYLQPGQKLIIEES